LFESNQTKVYKNNFNYNAFDKNDNAGMFDIENYDIVPDDYVKI